MRYDPLAPPSDRYVTHAAPIEPKLAERLRRDALALSSALGYDMNTVEFALRDGIPYAIDFTNPAPDADLHSVGQTNFDWIVANMAEIVVERCAQSAALRTDRSVAADDARRRSAPGTMSSRPSFTLGIEEEFQVVDPQTFELKSDIGSLFAEGKERVGDQMIHEMHAPVIEVRTPVCANVREARGEISRLRAEVIGLARRNGTRIASAGTHPFTHWSNVPITPGNAHYERLIEDLQMIARANLIFGLHVHVGVEDDNARIAIMNGVRYFLPHIFALSVNSPFWTGQNTGWKSYRSKIFERFPTHRFARFLRLVGRVSGLRQHAHSDGLHHRREEDLVGRARAPVLSDARVPHLRRTDARRRDALFRGLLSSRHLQALETLRCQPGLEALSALG